MTMKEGIRAKGPSIVNIVEKHLLERKAFVAMKEATLVKRPTSASTVEKDLPNSSLLLVTKGNYTKKK